MGQESGNGFVESSNAGPSHAIKHQLETQSSQGSTGGETTSRLTHVVIRRFSSSPVFGQRELRCWPEGCLSSLPPEPLHGVSHNMDAFFIRVSKWESKRGLTRWKLESFCNVNLGVTFHPYAYVLFIRSNSGHIQREGITYRHAY